MDLQGRSVIVTGGAGGLGAATARHFVGLGVATVVVDMNEAGVAQVCDELGPLAVGVPGSILEEADVAHAVEVAQGLGTFSLVANVAGGGIAGRTVARDGTPHPLDDYRRVIELNVVGTFNVSRLAAAAMAGNEPDENGERGVIVQTASIAGIEGQSGQVAYASAKGGIIGMTLPMARDLAVIGVRVMTIAPGTMGTPIMKSMPDAMREPLVAQIQFPKRLGEPEEFALLIEQIARTPYLNGEVIRLDGALRFPPK